MRALTISAHGGLEQLQVRDDLPMPEVRSASDIRVRVRAAALNHIDLFAIEGLPGMKLMPPWVVGSDACGIVDAVGADVRNVSPGDYVVINPGMSDRTCEYCKAGEQPLCVKFSVLGEHLSGTVAEYIVVPAINSRPVPAAIEPPIAAAFPLATLTAWRMAHTRARVRPGDRVLIWGIGGGVALAALQICKEIGAEVWVTSRRDDKLARAKALGADHVIKSDDDVAAIIRKQTSKAGIDVVFDNVGAATWEQSIRMLAKRGRLVTCGGTSGPVLPTDVRRVFWNQLSILGSTMGNDEEFDAITREFRLGRLRPPVDSVWSLDDGRAAFERLASGEQFGKVVISLE